MKELTIIKEWPASDEAFRICGDCWAKMQAEPRSLGCLACKIEKMRAAADERVKTDMDLQARLDEIELAYAASRLVILQAKHACDNKLWNSAKAILSEALKPTPREKEEK